MTPSLVSRLLNTKTKSPAIGSRKGLGPGRSAAKHRASGDPTVKSRSAVHMASKGTQRKAAAVPVPAPPVPDEPIESEPEKVRFDFKKMATPESDNLSGESQYIKRGSAEQVNKDANMITKFNLKAKKKKAS